jgi:hypothetical protein
VAEVFTCGGISRDGSVAYVGTCCKLTLREIHGIGVFSEHDRHEWSIDDVTTMKKYKNTAADMAKRAGVAAEEPQLRLRDSPWKADDSKWFEANPLRSHRMRLPFPGELETENADQAPPPEHEVKILVRQVEPGWRIRRSFLQYKAVPIPDVEPVIHALFDLVSQRPQTQSISGRELAELALRYAEAADDT